MYIYIYACMHMHMSTNILAYLFEVVRRVDAPQSGGFLLVISHSCHSFIHGRGPWKGCSERSQPSEYASYGHTGYVSSHCYGLGFVLQLRVPGPLWIYSLQGSHIGRVDHVYEVECRLRCPGNHATSNSSPKLDHS